MSENKFCGELPFCEELPFCGEFSGDFQLTGLDLGVSDLGLECQTHVIDDDKKISDLKKALLKVLMRIYGNEIKEGYRNIYNSTRVLCLLERHNVIKDLISIIGTGSSSFCDGSGIDVYQYEFSPGNLFYIVINYSWGSRDHDDPDWELYNSLHKYDDDGIRNLLERDLESKFNSFEFFLDLNKVVSYIENNSIGFKVDFF